MYHFCTLFDRNYLFKGLALHSSLREHCNDFTLHVLCMDDIVFDVLRALHLGNTELIRLVDFEDEGLLRAKRDRSIAEYCWTCTPSLPLYILNRKNSVNLITYLDADLYFFGDLTPIIAELSNDSILIIEHRLPQNLSYLIQNGRYNVEFLSFRRNADGLACLNWWRERCNEWCFNRHEEGKFGDQKYLDDWPTRFRGVHVLQHKGAGVAPWNHSLYRIEQCNGQITVDGVPLIFYHFHQFRIFSGGRYYLAPNTYAEEKPLPMEIYSPYIRTIERAVKTVRKIRPKYRYGLSPYALIMLRSIAREYLPTAVKVGLKKVLGKSINRFV